jgi:hypothetical protein
MSDHQSSAGSRFVVDLGSVKLPAIAEKQVETEIRAVVLHALAENDFGARLRLPGSIFDMFPGRTLGLWLDPEAQIPWSAGPLQPADHTLIVSEVMTHPFHILRALGVGKGDPAPSGRDVLEAALDVDVIDSFAKERIRMVLDVLAEIEPVMAKPTREMKRGVAYVEDLVAGRPLAEQVRLLRDPQTRMKSSSSSAPGPDPDWLQQILQWILEMLEDGASTIYSADFGFHRTVRSGRTVARERDAVDTIKDADAIGATGGGFAGTVIPGVGTAAGAAAGGAGASAGAAIVELIDWLF